jgi:hypothetical protein
VRPSRTLWAIALLFSSADVTLGLQVPIDDHSARLTPAGEEVNIVSVVSGGKLPLMPMATLLRARQSQGTVADLSNAEQLVHDGRYQEAYDLLTPFEASSSGDSNFNYLLGRAALGIGETDKAKSLFEHSIELRPDWIAPHLGLGRAYFALGDYEQARIEFETVLRFDNLPPDLLTQVEIYDRAAQQYLEKDRRLIGFAFAEAGMGHYWEHNTALTRASGGDDDLRRDPFYNARLGIGLDQVLSDSYLLDASLDYRFRDYYSNSDIRNDSDWRWAAEVSRTLGENNVALGVRGRVSNRGNGYRNDYGVFANWRVRLNATNQLSLEGEVRRRSYPTGRERDLSRNIGEGWVRWTHAFSDRGDFSLSANGGSEWASSIPDGNASILGAEGDFNLAVTKRFDVFLFALWLHHNFNENQTHFDPALNTIGEFSRVDNDYELGGGVVWNLGRGWSVRPDFLYIRELSNVPINDYHSMEFRVNVRKYFY